jgi:hypothetical protein
MKFGLGNIEACLAREIDAYQLNGDIELFLIL